MNGLETTLRLLGVRARLGRHERWSRGRLERYQATALRELRAHAYARSSFYRRRHAGLEDAPLEALPIVTKDDLIAHRDEIATDPRLRDGTLEAWLAEHPDEPLFGRYWPVATSGSSGEPLALAYDVAEWAHVLASFARGTDWAGLEARPWRRIRIATVATTRPWHMSSRAALTLPHAWTETLRLDVADPLAESVRRLNAWRPDLLVTYPSIATILAAEQLAGRLRIAPDVVMSGAEVLTEEVRRRVDAAWTTRLVDHYAASETGGLASECQERRGLHLFEDQVLVEVVDAQHRPVPAGAFGDRLLVTVLFSRTFPLIRYELTDSLRLAQGSCPCGRPFLLIDRIAGRTEETLWLRGSSGRGVAVHPVVIHGVMDALRVPGWQVLATPERLVVRLSCPADPSVDDRVAAELRAVLRRIGVVDPRVDVERVATIDRGPTGKAPLIARGAEAIDAALVPSG